MLFALPVEDREQEGNHCGSEPEPADIGEVVDASDDVVVEKQACHDVLQAGGGVGCDSNDAEGGAACLAGDEVNRHQAAEEADKHADGDAEEDH